MDNKNHIEMVAQVVPTFCMSSFLLSVSLCQEMERMINSFLWDMKPYGTRRINWIKWDTLCLRREQGGIGFQNCHSFNLALLGKHGWNFISKPHTLASWLIKDKYFPQGDMSAQLDSNPSYIWKSI